MCPWISNSRVVLAFDSIAKVTSVRCMRIFPSLVLLFATALFVGCSTTQNEGFVKSVNFSSLDSFTYKTTLVTGMEFRESESIALEAYSEEVIAALLIRKGFEETLTGGDFEVVVKWKKAVSSYPSAFDHVDGFSDQLNRRDYPTHSFGARMHLTVEIYETATGNLFWRNELPNIFDANQFTEERVIASLRHSVVDFPARTEKDPNLPSIE